MLNVARRVGAETRTVALPTGTLDLRVDAGSWTIDQLCGFAARNNPKRGFLVVSRVLGRHLPTRPALMRRSARDLAALVPADLPGPVLVFGLAETAICLGQTVHAELRALTGRDDIFFLHSTRQRIDHPLLCRFDEPHSHASAHLVYQPAVPGFVQPRSLVLVDDEISTGRTLINLAEALTGAWDRIETIAALSLTDWSDGAWLANMPRPSTRAALLEGQLTWTPSAQTAPCLSFETAAPALGRLHPHRNFGRLGLRAPLAEPFPSCPPTTGPIRIIGTGEFTHPPFLLAETLEQEGHDVIVQAVSRSPARLGGAIATALRFADNYGTDVPNYLYNVDPADGRANWFGFETGQGSIDPTLVDALDGQLLRWPA
jgi:hypothetical protein